MKYSIYTLLLTAFLFSACEETMVVIPEINNECTDKVILIEELTGVSCPNCPRGTEAIEQILALFPDKVVVYAIHGDFLAQPKSNSKYDFRSEVGREMENYLLPWLGKPSAAIDRFQFVGFEDGWVSTATVNQWISRVEDRCQTPKSVDLVITSDFDSESRMATINVTATGATPVVGELRMNLAITESHLIDPQDAGQQGIIEDYEHNHIFRDRLSSIEGDFLITDLSVDQSVSKTYTYQLPDEDNGQWMIENMEVVAFVTDGEVERGNVLQAAQVHMD